MALNLTTFSIVARDPLTNNLGIAVSTKVPAVGSLCPFIEHGVGAVATQAWVNPSLGPAVLAKIKSGLNALDALNQVMTLELDPQLRQVGVVDFNGASASYTGLDNDSWAGHANGTNYSIQGNMLINKNTVLAMEKTFLNAQNASLSERLLLALESGQNAGGDKRGRQSAALLVRNGEVFPLVDLRVDEHENPVIELRRVYEIAKVELFPFLKVLPTPLNPRGDFEKVRTQIAPKK